MRIYWLDGIRGTEVRGLILKVCVKGVWNVNHQICCEVFGRRMGSDRDVAEGGHSVKKESESVGAEKVCISLQVVILILARNVYRQ